MVEARAQYGSSGARAPWLAVVAVLAARSFAAPPPTPRPSPAPTPDTSKLRDLALLLDPALAYPDRKELEDLNGTLRATFHAAGEHSFRKNDLVEKVSFEMTLTLDYVRDGASETVTTAANGTKTATRGRHFEKDTYSGSVTKRVDSPRKLTAAVSEKLGLARFMLPRGDVIVVMAPVKLHIETEESSSDIDGVSVVGNIPGRGMAPTRWASLVNEKDVKGISWMETTYAKGRLGGTFTTPVFWHDGAFFTESTLRASGVDPSKAPENSGAIYWPGTLTFQSSLGTRHTDEATVRIDGCAHVVMGKTAKLTAKGRPAGGIYKWYGLPGSILDVTETGAEVTVTPLKAGRALILVEYRPPGGGVAETDVSGSVAEVRSVNGGAAIPEIGLYDENGHTAPPTRVPVDQVPSEGDLVSYPVADPGLAKVVNEGPSLLIQGGPRVGKTTTQAQTVCKLKTGPVLDINVVRCTKETRDRQFEKEKEAQKKVIEDADRAREALEGEKIEEAAKKLSEHTVDAFAKLSELLLSLTSGPGHATAESLEHGLEAAGKLYTAWKMMQGNGEAATVLLALLNPSTKKVAEKYELYESWKEYLHDLDTILSALDKNHEELQRLARDQEELDLLKRRHASICGKKPGDGEPPPSPTPTPPAPTKKPPPPEPPTPPPDPPTPPLVPPDEPPAPPDEPREPPVIPPPEPPAPPPATGGFPYLACGCQTYTTSAWTKNAAGLMAVGTDLSKTQSCAKEFAGRVETLGNDLQNFGDAFARAQQAAGLPREEGLLKLESAIDFMKTSLSGIKGFGKDAETVTSSLGKCGDTMKTVGAVVDAVTAPETSKKPAAIPDSSGRN